MRRSGATGTPTHDFQPTLWAQVAAIGCAQDRHAAVNLSAWLNADKSGFLKKLQGESYDTDKVQQLEEEEEEDRDEV